MTHKWMEVTGDTTAGFNVKTFKNIRWALAVVTEKLTNNKNAVRTSRNLEDMKLFLITNQVTSCFKNLFFSAKVLNQVHISNLSIKILQMFTRHEPQS